MGGSSWGVESSGRFAHTLKSFVQRMLRGLTVAIGNAGGVSRLNRQVRGLGLRYSKCLIFNGPCDL